MKNWSALACFRREASRRCWAYYRCISLFNKVYGVSDTYVGRSIGLRDRQCLYWKIQGRSGANAGEMSCADTIEAAVACAWILSIESSGKRESLLDISSTRRLQRMSSSFVIAGVSKELGRMRENYTENGYLW